MSSSPAELLRIEVETRGSAIIAKLIGSALVVVTTNLETKLLELADGRPEQLVLDLSRLEFISSVGLGAIIAAHLRCRHHHGVVKLVGPTPEILELLKTTRLHRLFPIHGTVDEALSSQTS